MAEHDTDVEDELLSTAPGSDSVLSQVDEFMARKMSTDNDDDVYEAPAQNEDSEDLEADDAVDSAELKDNADSSELNDNVDEGAKQSTSKDSNDSNESESEVGDRRATVPGSLLEQYEMVKSCVSIVPYKTRKSGGPEVSKVWQIFYDIKPFPSTLPDIQRADEIAYNKLMGNNKTKVFACTICFNNPELPFAKCMKNCGSTDAHTSNLMRHIRHTHPDWSSTAAHPSAFGCLQKRIRLTNLDLFDAVLLICSWLVNIYRGAFVTHD